MPNESLNLNLLCKSASVFLLHLVVVIFLIRAHRNRSTTESQEGNAQHSTVPAKQRFARLKRCRRYSTPTHRASILFSTNHLHRIGDWEQHTKHTSSSTPVLCFSVVIFPDPTKRGAGQNSIQIIYQTVTLHIAHVIKFQVTVDMDCFGLQREEARLQQYQQGATGLQLGRDCLGSIVRRATLIERTGGENNISCDNTFTVLLFCFSAPAEVRRLREDFHINR